MNSTLLQSVAQDILDEKLKLDMNLWYEGPTDFNLSAEEAACGTTACIAGWLAIKGGTAEQKRALSRRWYYTPKPHVRTGAILRGVNAWAYAALEALGVEWDSDLGQELNKLFIVSGTAAKYILPYLAQGQGVTAAMELGYEDYYQVLIDATE